MLLHVLGERRRHLAVGERAVAVLGHAPPRAEVHLVDRHRRVERVALARASPSSRRRSTRSRGPRRSTRCAAASRCRRRTDRPCRRGSRRSARRCGTCRPSPLPTSGTKPSQMPDVAARLERVRARVPAVEVADDADALRVRRPDGEDHRRPATMCAPSFSHSLRCVPSLKRWRSQSERSERASSATGRSDRGDGRGWPGSGRRLAALGACAVLSVLVTAARRVLRQPRAAGRRPSSNSPRSSPRG